MTFLFGEKYCFYRPLIGWRIGDLKNNIHIQITGEKITGEKN